MIVWLSGRYMGRPSSHSFVKVICSSPVPSARMRQRSMLPLVWRPNTIHWPSGETEISAS